jgi:hypothetical protein
MTKAHLFQRPWFVLSALLAALQFAARADQAIYTDSLQDDWVNWSWATVNLANSTPVHSGSDSISVTTSNYSALYLHVSPMDSSLFTNFIFWIDGGPNGGQSVVFQATLDGVAPTNYVALSPLPANSWRQVTVPLSALGVANQPDLDGFWIQSTVRGSQAAFYVDDITLQSVPPLPPSTNANVTIQIDARAGGRPISPLIYGVAFAPASNQLQDLNVPIHRSGGNATTRYNWQLNATSHAADWYFESLAETSSAPGGDGDSFIQESKDGGAQAMLTIPIIGWVANLQPNRNGLASFSVAKYGPQTATDPWWPDAGNGVSTNGLHITNNAPTDANIIADTNFQAGWVRHLTNQWGLAASGGLRYYLMDNEWSIWHSTHRDVHPVGATMDEVLGKFCATATMVKAIDPNALVAGPEEWGWLGYFYSGYDQQYGSLNGWGVLPDRAAHGGQDFAPWFLSQVNSRGQAAGRRLLDVFTLHCYPQGGEALSNGVSASMQLLRNRSTRSLWDTNYVDESWINSIVMLIPRMKNWVATNYPGTLTGITEYNWGADDSMNGATAQADLLGIFGREGLDLATRWTCPNPGTPAYNAFKMYRNYDGNKSTFGDTNLPAAAPNPDSLAVFAALRASDGAMTLMVINKDLNNAAPVTLAVTNFAASGPAQVWQLSSNNISHLAGVPFTNGTISNVVPAQSITLFVLPPLPPFHLRTNAGAAPGQWNIWLDGQAGQTYALQSSADLLHWSPVSTNTLASNSFAFPISTAAGAIKFYRALWLP